MPWISGNEISRYARVSFRVALQSFARPSRWDGDVFFDESDDVRRCRKRRSLLQLSESQSAVNRLMNDVRVIKLREIFRGLIRAIINENDDSIRDILLQDAAQHSLRPVAVIVSNQNDSKNGACRH
jgi:hypothetical protein